MKYETVHTFHHEPIALDELGAPELRRAAETGGGQAYRITIYATIEQQLEEPDPAFALHDPKRERLGIAWRSDVTWADVRGLTLERAIGLWLNLRHGWDARAL